MIRVRDLSTWHLKGVSKSEITEDELLWEKVFDPDTTVGLEYFLLFDVGMTSECHGGRSWILTVAPASTYKFKCDL